MKITARSNSMPQLRLGRKLTLLLGIWIGTAVARIASAEEISLASAIRENETTSWKTDSSVLAATPSWDGRGKPPFDVATLIDKAAQSLTKLYPAEASTLRLHGINVRRVTSLKKGVDLEGRWYIQFTYTPDSGKLVFTHVVLLADGTTVDPMVKTR